MGPLITIIVIIAVIVQVVKAINEQRTASGGDSKDSWWEEETPSSTPGQSSANRPPAVPTAAPAPRPTPSPHVQEILRHLQQQAQRAAAPSSPKPVAVVVPPPATEAPARRYLEEETVETELSHAAREATDRAVAEVYTKSVTAAFPMTRPITLRRHSGQRTAIRVLSRNRRNLRQAILLGEVLGPPRAFDL